MIIVRRGRQTIAKSNILVLIIVRRGHQTIIPRVFTSLFKNHSSWHNIDTSLENNIMNPLTKIIPHQHTGFESETVYSVEKKTPKEARQLYAKAKANLLDVNHWHDLLGKDSVDFQLTDADGHEKEGIVRKGDYFRINIKSTLPGTDKYDWVKVEDIQEGHIDGISDWTIVKIKPVDISLNHSGETIHFFTTATSNFFVKRQRHKVTAAIVGKNKTRHSPVNNFWLKIKNAFVELGSMIGLNRPQWKRLVKGVLLK